VETQEQLQWEARASRPAAIAAFGSAALLIGTAVYQATAIQGAADTPVERVMTLDAESTDFIVSAVMQSVGVLLLAVVLWYLFRAAKARRRELPSIALPLAIGAPVLVAGVGIAFGLDRAGAAAELVAAGPFDDQAAEDLIAGTSSELVIGLGFAANLALGFALVLIALNAMRAGLLSRFMGIIGIVIGALFVIPLIGSPLVIQLFWSIALGLLFLDRWPGGRGPAWTSGEAVKWPSAAEQRAEVERGRAGPEEDGRAEQEDEWLGPRESGREAAGEREASAEDATAPAPRPTQRKRKRRR